MNIEGRPRSAAAGARHDEMIFAQGPAIEAPTESERAVLLREQQANEAAIKPLMEQQLKIAEEIDTLSESDVRLELLNRRLAKVKELLDPLIQKRGSINKALN